MIIRVRLPYRTRKREMYYSQVISLYRDEHMGVCQISRIVPVSSSTISNWIRTFVAQNPEIPIERMKKSVKPKAAGPAPCDAAKSKDVKELQSEVERLTKELSRACMRADAYDELIKVAEKKFNIAIRKKAGTKQ